MLVADAALAIDDEGLGDAVDPPIDADPSVVGADPGVGIAERGDPAARSHWAASTITAVRCRARRAGAPTRWRRSVSEMTPPSAITTAPSQIHGTSGFQ